MSIMHIIVELNTYSPLPVLTQYCMTVVSLYLIECIVVVTCLRLTTTLLLLHLFLRLWNNNISAEMEASLHKDFPGRVTFTFI